MNVFQSKKRFNSNWTIKRVIRPLFKRPDSTLSGFKKKLFQGIIIHDGELFPILRRRKHKITYGLTFNHPLQMLSKIFGNLRTAHFKWHIATSIEAAFKSRHITRNGINFINLKAKTACFRLADAIETQTDILLYRNLHTFSLPKTRQELKHRRLTDSSDLYIRAYAYFSKVKVKKYHQIFGAENLIWLNPGEILRIKDKNCCIQDS